jgi:hypothetical protein
MVKAIKPFITKPRMSLWKFNRGMDCPKRRQSI